MKKDNNVSKDIIYSMVVKMLEGNDNFVLDGSNKDGLFISDADGNQFNLKLTKKKTPVEFDENGDAEVKVKKVAVKPQRELRENESLTKEVIEMFKNREVK